LYEAGNDHFDAEQHNKIVEGQKGNFVFEAAAERESMRVYEIA